MSDQQILISYARGDDEVLPGVERGLGFVSTLLVHLKADIQTRGPPTPVLWFDRRLVNVGDFHDFLEPAKTSSIFMAIMSPLWLASDFCQRELQVFVKRWTAEGGLPVSGRVVLVGRRPVENEKLPALLRELVSINFYNVSDRGSAVREHQFFKHVQIVDPQYYERVRTLSELLWRRAKESSLESADSMREPRAAMPLRSGILKEVSPGAAPQVPPAPVEVAEIPKPSREQPEYWIRHVEVERKLSPGGDPLVLVSYATEDQAWVDELHAFIELRIGELNDPDGRPYELWNFSNAKRGTVPGDEFPEIVAEKMWRCRAAIILLSRDYFKSRYCRTIELPFLMWRWEHQKIMCMPVKLGTVPIDKVKIPPYRHASRNVILDELIDDRQAVEEFAASPHRERNLKELKELNFEAEIEKRFDGVGRRVVEFLKKRHGALDD